MQNCFEYARGVLLFYVISRRRAQKALKEQKTHANYSNFNWSLMHSLRSCFQERSRLNEFENILMRILLTMLVSMVKFFEITRLLENWRWQAFFAANLTFGDAGKINENISDNIFISKTRQFKCIECGRSCYEKKNFKDFCQHSVSDSEPATFWIEHLNGKTRHEKSR